MHKNKEKCFLNSIVTESQCWNCDPTKTRLSRKSLLLEHLGKLSRQKTAVCEVRGNKQTSSTLHKPWAFGTLKPSLPLQEERSPPLKPKHSHSDSSFTKACCISNMEPSLLLHISDGLSCSRILILPTSFWQILILSVALHSENIFGLLQHISP